MLCTSVSLSGGLLGELLTMLLAGLTSSLKEVGIEASLYVELLDWRLVIFVFCPSVGLFCLSLDVDSQWHLGWVLG